MEGQKASCCLFRSRILTAKCKSLRTSCSCNREGAKDAVDPDVAVPVDDVHPMVQPTYKDRYEQRGVLQQEIKEIEVNIVFFASYDAHAHTICTCIDTCT